MNYPEFLKENGTIGFVAPSFGCAIEPYKTAFGNALKKFKNNNFSVQLGKCCYDNCGVGISNEPKACAEDFMQMYKSKSNNILLSCGGGELMNEILDYIDFQEFIANKPKWFMGYSDNTNLTFLLTTIADVASIYGINAPNFGMEKWHKCVEDAFQLIQGKRTVFSNYDLWEKESLKSETNPLASYNVTEKFELKTYPVLNDVQFEGRLIGGCLDVLSNLCGTRFDKVTDFIKKYKEDGFVWFLESCDLNVFDMRRALWRLKQCGWFQHVRGFLIGRPYKFDEPIMNLDRHSAVIDVLKEYNVPIIMDLDIGHIAPTMPMICGSIGKINVENNSITINMLLK